MSPMTGAERIKRHREKMKAAGLKEVRNLWAYPDDHDKIRAYVEKLNKAQEAK